MPILTIGSPLSATASPNPENDSQASTFVSPTTPIPPQSPKGQAAATQAAAPSQATAPAARRSASSYPPLDVSFLLRPSLYQSIPTINTLPPFLSPSHAPPPGSTLHQLISANQFRHAAIKAATDLCTGAVAPSMPDLILQTFHTRLSCLILCGHAEIATAEARPLIDFISRTAGAARETAGTASTAATGPLGTVPWALRLLLHRLQYQPAADGRKAVMALYVLGGECRGGVAAADADGDTAGAATWRARLFDLGVRVGGELLEMGEWEAAARHLHTLGDAPRDGGGEAKDDSLIRLALLHVKTGDVGAAEKAVNQMSGGHDRKGLLQALVLFARGELEAATDLLRNLHEDQPADVLIANNYAVALLYIGRMDVAAEVLEKLASDTNAQPTSGALFNLATLYELTTERAVDKKVKLVERVAARGPADGGWERQGVEFKL